MKVLHCLNHYLPEQVAGTEVYTAALVRELQLVGVICKVVIPNYHNHESEYYQFENTTVIKYAEPSLLDRDLITGIKQPQGLVFFTNILKQELPDVVHFHELAGSNGLSLIHVQAAKAEGCKVIITFHIAKYTCRTGTLMYKNETTCDGIINKMKCSKCWLADKGQRGVKAAIITAGFSLINALDVDTRVWKNALGTALAFPQIIQQIKNDIFTLQTHTDAFVVLTDWYKKVLLNNGILHTHIQLIKQALPTPYVPSTSAKSLSNKLRLVFIGRINHFKGILLLIQALKNIPPQNVELDIYGKSTDEVYYSQCLLAAKSMDNVRWQGSVTPDNVVATIAKYDVLCLPSTVCEMAPLVIQEAFAASVPVLASNVYGNAEIITHNENGWLYNYNDVADLTNNINNLIANRILIDKAIVKIKAVKQFSTVAQEYVVLYTKILSA